MGAPRYLRLDKAAQKYGIGKEELQRAIEQGLVRAARVNGFIAVAEADIDKLRSSEGELSESIPRYLPLSEASRRYGISEEVLKRAIESGTIEAIQLDEEVAVAEGDVEKIIIRREDFEHLRGTPISVREAERKYGISSSTIVGWVKAGYITKLGQAGRRTLLDEADVAYCARVYEIQGGARGRRIFDEEGNPYFLKHPERTRHPAPVIEVL